MLLIKYFGNTKAMGFFKHRTPFRQDHHHKDIHCRQWTRNKTASSGQMRADHRASGRRPCPAAPLLVQTHGRALVHAHVRITEKSSCAALDPSGVQGVQVLGRHFQVLPHFWARGDLRNVEAVLAA